MSDVNNEVPRKRNLIEEQSLYPKVEEFNPLLKDVGASPTSLLLAILKNVRIGQDLTSFDTPTTLLSGRSCLEKLGDAYKPTETLFELFKETNAEKRMLLVIKHILENFTAFIANSVSHYKPFNPILGEQLFMHWDAPDGSVFKFVGEQVSHHPPISSFVIENETHKFKSNVTLGSKITFKGNSIEATFRGYRCISLPHPTTGEMEHYEFDGDSTHGTGIFIGSARFGFTSTMYVRCREHPELIGSVKFSDVSKAKGKVKCKSKPTSKKFDKKIYRFTGDLLGKITLEEMATKSKSVMIEMSKINHFQKTVPQLIEMGPLESRMVWHDVFYGICKKDQTIATAHKHYVENVQRKKKKERQAKGEVWTPLMFTKQESSPNGILPYYEINKEGRKKLTEQEEEDLEVSEDDLD